MTALGLRAGRQSGIGLPAVAALSMLSAYAVIGVLSAVANWFPDDTGAYLGAADRVLSGEALYPLGADPDAAHTYRYAPWFAIAWIPVTFLPRDAVMIGWSAVLLAASVNCMWRCVRHGIGGLALGLLLVPQLVWTAALGNVQPVVVALLMSRWSFLGVVVASSLKVTPALIGFGWWPAWKRIGAAWLLGAALWAHALWFGLAGYPTEAGQAWVTGPLWLHAAFAGTLIIAAILAPKRYSPAFAAMACIAALPRLHLYDLTFLLAAVPPSVNERTKG